MSGKITKRILNVRGCMNYGGGNKKQGVPSTTGVNLVMFNMIRRRTYHL